MAFVLVMSTPLVAPVGRAGRAGARSRTPPRRWRLVVTWRRALLPFRLPLEHEKALEVGHDPPAVNDDAHPPAVVERRRARVVVSNVRSKAGENGFDLLTLLRTEHQKRLEPASFRDEVAEGL